MQLRESVKCVTAGHARDGQAGVIISTDGKAVPKKVTVRWDLDQADEELAVGDLIELGAN